MRDESNWCLVARSVVMGRLPRGGVARASRAKCCRAWLAGITVAVLSMMSSPVAASAVPLSVDELTAATSVEGSPPVDTVAGEHTSDGQMVAPTYVQDCYRQLGRSSFTAFCEGGNQLYRAAVECDDVGTKTYWQHSAWVYPNNVYVTANCLNGVEAFRGKIELR